MNTDKFENKLASQRIREIPAEWRQEILARARRQSPAPEAPSRRDPSWTRIIREIFWPSPAAWGALGSLWIVAGFVGFLDAEPVLGRQRSSLPSPLEQRLAREQRTMLMEELGAVTLHPNLALPAAPVTPEGSRSEREGDQFGGVPFHERLYNKELA